MSDVVTLYASLAACLDQLADASADQATLRNRRTELLAKLRTSGETVTTISKTVGRSKQIVHQWSQAPKDTQ